MESRNFLVTGLHLLQEGGVLSPQVSLALQQLVHLVLELLSSFLSSSQLLAPDFLLLFELLEGI